MLFKSSKNQDDFMFNIPVKSHSNCIQKGNVTYLVFKHTSLTEKFTAWITRKPTIKDIRLDNLSTRVWQLIDGSNNVYRIGQILKREYDKDCEPVYERLTVYLKFLNRRGWVKFKRKDNLGNYNANLK